MVQWYKQWNHRLQKILWWVVIAGLVASIPMAVNRINREQSANKVEFVFDYRNLLEISDYRSNPAGFVADQLDQLKKAGVHSLAFYESSLNELKLERKIELFNSRDARALNQTPISPTENFTYLLFADAQAEKQYKPVIQKAFSSIGVNTRPWSYKNQPGLIIEMPMDEAVLKPMDPDFATMSELKAQGFHPVIRLSNRRAFVPEQYDAMLGEMKKLGVSRLIIDGEEVPGYNDDPKRSGLKDFSALLKKHGIGLSAIELLKQPQKGFDKVAKDIGYNVVRLHSFTEKDSDKLSESLSGAALKQQILTTSDRFVLAVKDRNIRMVFLHAHATKNADKAKIADPLNSIYASLQGPDGAVNRIQHSGFTLGQSQPFQSVTPGWMKFAKIVLFAAALSLLALTVSYFEPALALAVLALGVFGAAGLYVVSPSLCSQLLALAAAICAPSVAMIRAIRTVESGAAQKAGSRLGFSLQLFLRTTVTSLMGVLFIIGLLNGITYSLLLEQFRGVSALHLLPIVITVIYLLFYSRPLTLSQRAGKVGSVLKYNINVLWIIVAGAALAAIYYYLTRTGNAGQASAFEIYFRSFLENTLRIRPRTKEFLIAHPLFILGAYLSVRYKNAVYVMLIGVIGQLSIVDTFAHLHTPVMISAIRITYGIVFGVLTGIVFIVVWEFIARSWNRWAPVSKE